MDEITKYNKERWEELSAAGVMFSEPWLDLCVESARSRIDPEGQMGEVAGRNVLCLAASGGQQSAACGLLGARVTVVDIAENQLAKDRATAAHYGLQIRTVQRDMQDLSVFADREFDVVWLAHSINFVPDARGVIAQIGRIAAPRALVRMSFTNPYVHGAWERYKDGAFLLNQPYVDGGEVGYERPCWKFTSSDGAGHEVRGPREFRHSLATIFNSLVLAGFEIRGFWERHEGSEVEPSAEPGSWAHFKSIVPPFLTLWAMRKGAAA